MEKIPSFTNALTEGKEVSDVFLWVTGEEIY